MGAAPGMWLVPLRPRPSHFGAISIKPPPIAPPLKDPPRKCLRWLGQHWCLPSQAIPVRWDHRCVGLRGAGCMDARPLVSGPTSTGPNHLPLFPISKIHCETCWITGESAITTATVLIPTI